MLASSDVVFFNQIRPLATVEPSYDIESGVVEGDCRVEVSAGVEA